MTFVITIWTPEGIVMASDSRLTLNTTLPGAGGTQIQHLSTAQSDSVYKTFCIANKFGISTYGDADVQLDANKGTRAPLTGFIEAFANQNKKGTNLKIDRIPEMLIGYFKTMPVVPDTGFLVAGYKEENNKYDPRIWRVNVKTEEQILVNQPDNPGGAAWNGETDILIRLINPVYTNDATTGNYIACPSYEIPWRYFTLQDAIDYAVYAIQTTIDSIRFMTRSKTVGGPIDVLTIKPNGAEWIQRKGLRIQTYPERTRS